MFSRIKRDFDEGIGKVKWFATLFSERVRIELTVFRLLYHSEELKRRRDELLRTIGEKVYEIRASEKDVRLDSEVEKALREIEELDGHIKETVERASELSKIAP